MQFLEKTLVKDWLVLGPGFFSFSEKYSLSLQLWNCEAKDCRQKQASLPSAVVAKKKSRRIQKEFTKVARQFLSDKWKESIRKRLKTQSRQQALEKLVPRASLAKAKAVKKSILKKQKGKSQKKHESVKQLKDYKKDGAAALSSDSARAIEDTASQLLSMACSLERRCACFAWISIVARRASALPTI